MATTLGTVARSNLGKHRLRFALTSIGIAISAFFLSAVLISNLSLMTSLRESAAQFYGNSDLVLEDPDHSQFVIESPPYLSQKAAQQVQASSLVKSSWGVATADDVMYLAGSGAQEPSFLVKRTDLAADDSVLSLTLQEGDLPSTSSQVLIPSSLAQNSDLRVGQTVRMTDYTLPVDFQGLPPTSDFKISGIYAQKAATGPMNNMVFTGGSLTADYTKSREADPSSGYSMMMVKLAPGVSAHDFKQQLTSAGLEVAVSTVEEQIQKDVDDFTGGISQVTAVVLGFGLLSLLMSSFVIANTYRVYAASRTRELALLRTLGATRFALVRMLLLEAFMLGVLSALAGIVTAYGLAFLISTFMTGGYMIDFSPVPALISLFICGTVAVLSALAPAWSMRKISPITAIQSVPEPRTRSVLKKVWFWLLVLLLVALVAVGIFWAQSSPLEPGYVLATVALATLLVLVFPFFLSPLLAVTSRFCQPFTTAGMAHSNIRQAKGQTVASGRMLFICAAFLAALMTGFTSLKVSVLEDIERSYPFPASGFVSAQSWEASTRLEQEVQAFGGVDAATVAIPQGSLENKLYQDANRVSVYSLDASQLDRLAPYDFPHPLADDQLLINASSAESLGLVEGSKIRVAGTHKSQELTVVYTDTDLFGPVMTRVTGQRISGSELLATSPSPDSPALILGFDPSLSSDQQLAALKGLESQVGLAQGSLYGSLTMGRDIELGLNIGLYVALGLLGATLAITLIGIANTQILSAYQRRRPYALLRVAGMSKKQLRAMISFETTLVALLSILLGIGAGYACAILLLQVYATNGFSMNYSVHGWDLLLILIGGVALTWLTSLIPALRASRLSPVVSLQETP
ncbi:FtsX-like permease family protein [Rothia sp. P4278]|uniref:FtsX-like permease family protein n=1 Tax=Rothia sp. P4278 TaxID=3402658 RepID=UPI003AD9FCEF